MTFGANHLPGEKIRAADINAIEDAVNALQAAAGTGGYLARSGGTQEVTGVVVFDKLQAKSLQDTAQLGAELAGTTWTFGGATTSSGNGGKFNAGGGTMSQDLTGINSGSTYLVRWSASGATDGNRYVQLGTAVQPGGSVPFYYSQSALIVANASGTLALTFTGDALFDGTITNVSVMEVLGTSSPNVAYLNTAGGSAGELRGDGQYNTALGGNAISQNVSGNHNSALGAGALAKSVTGSQNTALGANALGNSSTGNTNTAVGFCAMQNATVGFENVAVGAQALQSTTTGASNSGVGTNALLSNTSGTSNSAVGADALTSNTTGNYNSALGAKALTSNTTGSENAANGYNALGGNTTGAQNTAAGAYALRLLTTGSSNTALGRGAGFAPAGDTTNATTTATGQTLVGFQSGQSSPTQVNYATALGYQALVSAAGAVAIGTDHTGVGASATVQDAFVLGTALHQVQISNNSTGAGSAALGANCPATTLTAPYTWLKMLAGDGSTIYVPGWK